MKLDLCEKILAIITDDQKGDNNILFDMNLWDWSQGVALYGIWKYYKITGDKRYLQYLCDWFDSKMEKPLERTVNTMAPVLTLCYLYEETKNEKYLAYCEETAAWLLCEMPKTQLGGFQHITMDSENNQQLWADTVFMAVLFLAKIGAVTNNPVYIGEAKKQFMLHIRFLADRKTGLWYHGWSFETGSNFAKALWARGNCWFTISAAEIPEILDLEPWVRDLILDTYRMQAQALKKYQAPNGLWHTLVDQEDSYVEASGSAGFAYGILKGVRMGYLPKEYQSVAKQAVEGVCACIDETGMVNQVSYGTIVADTLDYYKQVALRPTGYGQNLTLMMLVELMYWEKENLTL